MKKKPYGNTGGLKANHLRRLQNIYRRTIPPRFLVTPELARELFNLSLEIRRQVGVLVDRKGRVEHVIVGNDRQIVIPDISNYRAYAGRLRGLRCIHTHLGGEPLTDDDIADLVLLRLDVMAAIARPSGRRRGIEYEVHAAHILPGSKTGAFGGDPCKVLAAIGPSGLEMDCDFLISSIEEELAQAGALVDTGNSKERAILASVTAAPRKTAAESLEELAALAASADIMVVGTFIQSRKKPDPRFLVGSGKLGELAVMALRTSASLLIFDQELNPSQICSIADRVDLKVIDRTQLILDIFARRAQSMEGKLQVEHAQLKYLMPRLVGKSTAMSRLTGGIGGRGPGETKLEIDRRRVRDRITMLERRLESVRRNRRQQKVLREKRGLPVVSIIGYTNAGKSTLLGSLAKTPVAAEDRLFMTLDPANRRIRFPRDMEVIVTDTVGFIRDLPKELMVAFRATLEELECADIFIHVVDVSSHMAAGHVRAVNRILRELGLSETPTIYALNKRDRAPLQQIRTMIRETGGIPVSANNPQTLGPLVERLESGVEQILRDKGGIVGNTNKNK